MLRVCLAGLALLAFARVAVADILAVYRSDFAGETIIEISDSAAIRIGRSGEPYSDYNLFLGDRVYSVIAGPGGPVVLTMEAAATLADYERAQAIIYGDNETVDTPDTYRPVRRVVIAGQSGLRYDLDGSLAPDMSRVVLADTPELRPLGLAFLRARSLQNRLAGVPSDDEPDPLNTLLSGAGVLAIDNLELTSVRFDPIAPARFALPDEPISGETVRKRLGAVPQTQGDEEWKRVISAAYLKGRLYTLLSDGRMAVWNEGATRGQDLSVPGRVNAFCVLGSELFVLTGASQGDEAQAVDLGLWQADGAASWLPVATIKAERGQTFLALDCTGPSPGVLLSRAFHLPLEDKVIRLNGPMLEQGADYVTLQQGGQLYVGGSMGEWGGGLWQYALEGKAPGRAMAKGRCGLSGEDCANVTGLARDPRDPACLLVARGLIHFMSTGQMQRLCGTELSLAYAKPVTTESDWVFDGTLPPEAFSQVAFTSAVADGTVVWAMGTDGVYRFGLGGLEAFHGFEPFAGFAASGVDWSHPDYVLVSGFALRRHAVNDGALLLVPRRN